MIRVPLGQTPPSLDGPGSKGGLEMARACAFYAVQANGELPFSYAAYKDADVIEAYKADFHGKCAYCESKWQATQPVDSEHYRPKGGYFLKDGTLKKPGYYWLAADWCNLLPSCVDCNRGRTQTSPDHPTELAGKTNKFPIANESRRATRPGEEVREHRLLLNPRLDDPDEHLEFGADGTVRPRLDAQRRESRMGKASIEVYALWRSGLVDERRDTALDLQGAIDNARRAGDRLRAEPASTALREALVDQIGALRRAMAPTRTYAALSRQLAKPVIAELEAEFGQLGPDPGY